MVSQQDAAKAACPKDGPLRKVVDAAAVIVAPDAECWVAHKDVYLNLCCARTLQSTVPFLYCPWADHYQSTVSPFRLCIHFPVVFGFVGVYLQPLVPEIVS